MTVKQLREAIASERDDAIVFMAKDAEGNDYSLLADVDQEIVRDIDKGKSVEAVFLWPEN